MRTTLRGRRNRFAWRDDLDRRLHLDEDQWHDGRLVGLSIETRQRGSKPAVQVTLRVDVYGEGTHARHRTLLTATFGGVREVVTTLNGRELADTGDDHIVSPGSTRRPTRSISTSTWPAATSASSPSTWRYRRA